MASDDISSSAQESGEIYNPSVEALPPVGIEPAQESDANTAAGELFTCEVCGKEFPNKFSLLGHGRAHSKKAKPRLSEDSEEIARLKIELEQKTLEASKEKADRERTENELKRLKASRELSAMQSQASQDPLDKHIERILRLQEASLISGSNSNMHVQSRESGENNATLERLASLERQLAEEREERVRKAHDDALRESILLSVNQSLAATNSTIDLLNQRISSQPKSSDFVSKSIDGLTTVVTNSQANLAALVRSLLQAEEPKRPTGASANPLEQKLESLGLIDRDTSQMSHK